jgi:hypothetical protein
MDTEEMHFLLQMKKNTILIGWWAGILAFREVNNNHFLGFPP